MKRTEAKHSSFIFNIVLISVILVAVCLQPAIIRAEANRTARLTILHTNDLHSHFLPDHEGNGGSANIGAYIKSVKTEGHAVLVLDAGDLVQGTPVSTIFSGKPAFEVYNAIGYDAATLGNHEFDYGFDDNLGKKKAETTNMIAEYRKIADFPLLSANAVAGGELVADATYIILERDSVKYAILGISTDTSRKYECLDPIQTARRYIPELKEKGDIIIALSHLGIEADRKLAAEVDGIDIIVGGHSHTKMSKPEFINGTIIVQAGCHGLYVGRLDLQVDSQSSKIKDYSWHLVNMPAEGLPPDPETEKVVNKWEKKVEEKVNTKIGYNPELITISELKSHIEHIWKETYHTDFALQNDGGTRDSLPPGDILERNIYNILPFDNTLVILMMTRDQINERVDNAVFDKEKEYYSLITNSFAGDSIIEKFNLPEERIRWIDTSWRQPVIDYIKVHGNVLEPELIMR